MAQSFIWLRLVNTIGHEPKGRTMDSGDLATDHAWLSGTDSNGTPNWQDASPIPSLRDLQAASIEAPVDPDKAELDQLRDLAESESLTAAQQKRLLKHLTRRVLNG